MIRFIVIDRQEGFSWLNDSLDEIKVSTGFDDLSKIKYEYEIIKIEGEFKIEYLP